MAEQRRQLATLVGTGRPGNLGGEIAEYSLDLLTNLSVGPAPYHRFQPQPHRPRLWQFSRQRLRNVLSGYGRDRPGVLEVGACLRIRTPANPGIAVRTDQHRRTEPTFGG